MNSSFEWRDRIMCYKDEVQKKNAEKLLRKFDEDNVPKFIRDFFLQISSRTVRINYWVTIKEILAWLIKNKYINRENISENMTDIRKA